MSLPYGQLCSAAWQLAIAAIGASSDRKKAFGETVDRNYLPGMAKLVAVGLLILAATNMRFARWIAFDQMPKHGNCSKMLENEMGSLTCQCVEGHHFSEEPALFEETTVLYTDTNFLWVAVAPPLRFLLNQLRSAAQGITPVLRNPRQQQS